MAETNPTNRKFHFRQGKQTLETLTKELEEVYRFLEQKYSAQIKALRKQLETIDVSDGNGGSTTDLTAIQNQLDSLTKQVSKIPDLTNLSPSKILITNAGGQITTFALGGEGQVLAIVSGSLGWASPLTNPMTTIGDIIVGGTDGAATRLGVGAVGKVLKVVSENTIGWGDDETGESGGESGFPAEPAKGDILYFDGEDWIALNIGTDGQFLTVATDIPAWSNLPEAEAELPTGAKGNILYHDGTNWVALSAGANGQHLAVQSDGSLNWEDPPEPSEGGDELPEGALGDLLYHNGSGWVALPSGAEGQVLVVQSDDSLAWEDPPEGSGGGGVSGPPVGEIETEYTLSFAGDDDGVIFAIATDFGSSSFSNPHTAGKVVVTRSSNGTGTEADLVDRISAQNTHTSNASNSWAAIDLGENRSLVVTDYTLQCRGQFSSLALRNWKLQGSNDVVSNSISDLNLATWTDIDTRSGDTTMAATAGSWGEYSVSGTPAAYRWFRIYQTGTNADGTNYLGLAEIELYGTLFRVGGGTTDGAVALWSGVGADKLKNSDIIYDGTTLALPAVNINESGKLTLLTASTSVNWPSISANSDSTQNITVTGAVTTGTPAVWIGWSQDLPAGIVLKQARVSAADTVAVTLRNVTDGALDPSSLTCRVVVARFE